MSGMRRAASAVFVVLAWSAVATALSGFFRPWAVLGVNERILGTSEEEDPRARLQHFVHQISQKVGSVKMTVHNGSHTISGPLPDFTTLPREVSGFEIPLVANRQDTQATLALTGMLTGHPQLGRKCYAVYLVPLFALLCGVVISFGRRQSMLCLAVAAVCSAIALVLLARVLYVERQALMVTVRAGIGLWWSCWAFVGLSLAGLGLAIWPEPGPSNS